MTPEQLRTLTAEQLDQARRDVLAEVERREALDAIPEQVADLAKTYAAGGGDPDDLRAVIE